VGVESEQVEYYASIAVGRNEAILVLDHFHDLNLRANLIDVVTTVHLLKWRHGVMVEVPGVDGHQMGDGMR
jgi:hypothetical protein